VSQEKTKIVVLGESRYQLRRLSPEAGSFIAMKLLSAAESSSKEGGGPGKGESGEGQGPALPTPSGEQMVRIVALLAFNGLDFETHSFIQHKCLGCCFRLEGGAEGGPELPMPIVNASGAWAIPEIRDDMALVMKLELEALVFSVAPFFESGGLVSLAPGPPKE
jgi:hypothetical protein